MPPRVTGVLETCLYVENVERSRSFYEKLFGFKTLVGDKRICVFDVAPAQVLILFERGATQEPVPVGDGFIPPHDAVGRQHFAFAIAADDFDPWKRHLAANGIDVESEIAWRSGGKSLYFRDPDGLLVELATPGLWANY
jgi:catechol 2,3-dioxygenase-like lactoylglutathione lyase family enzyme